ncbi:MAG: zf-HC2 domain-containing protein [Desulfosarcina sp.]|nr:zf-HC2 domain-containing protein [Desulfosarcina sp.]MBC2765270.1 zf-HC2 domain-containing protein [Desulfosarcina sp.]
MKHWMFRCKDVSQKVSQSMDVQLPYHHRMAVQMHLLMCRYCARFRRQLIMLRKMSRHVDSDQHIAETTSKLSQETKERMKERLRALS